MGTSDTGVGRQRLLDCGKAPSTSGGPRACCRMAGSLGPSPSNVDNYPHPVGLLGGSERREGIVAL